MKNISTFHTESDVLLEQAFNQFRSQFQQIISIEKQNQHSTNRNTKFNRTKT
jgi:hypothetical protein